MQRLLFYILTLLVFVGCADDTAVLSDQDVDFCVRALWQNGRCATNATRTLSATDILTAGNGDIDIAIADYPAEIDVHCSDGTDFYLTKGSAFCSTHPEYWSYTPSVIYKDNKIKRDGLIFTARAVIDTDSNEDVVTGECAFADIHDRHILLSLHHTKALLRFAFAVSEKYDQIRYIQVTGIKLNNAECTVVDKILSTSDMTYIGYAYIDPKVVTVSSNNSIECTYTIYDKDAKFDGSMDNEELAKHITRPDIKVRNNFIFSKLEFNDSPVVQLQPGFYYDLNVTLNPDYLYVLSDHDNKHITVN